MKVRLFEKSYEQVEIDAGAETEWIDVGGLGGDSIAATIIATNESSPTGSNVQFQGAIREDKSDAVLVSLPVDVDGDGVFYIEIERPHLRYYRLVYAIASGSYTADTSVLVKGDRDA